MEFLQRRLLAHPALKPGSLNPVAQATRPREADVLLRGPIHGILKEWSQLNQLPRQRGADSRSGP